MKPPESVVNYCKQKGWHNIRPSAGRWLAIDSRGEVQLIPADIHRPVGVPAHVAH